MHIGFLGDLGMSGISEKEHSAMLITSRLLNRGTTPMSGSMFKHKFNTRVAKAFTDARGDISGNLNQNQQPIKSSDINSQDGYYYSLNKLVDKLKACFDNNHSALNNLIKNNQRSSSRPLNTNLVDIYKALNASSDEIEALFKDVGSKQPTEQADSKSESNNGLNF